MLNLQQSENIKSTCGQVKLGTLSVTWLAHVTSYLCVQLQGYCMRRQSQQASGKTKRQERICFVLVFFTSHAQFSLEKHVAL